MRLIEIQPSKQAPPANLTIAQGDVLRFAASGGRVLTGDAMESLGAFVRGVIGTDGTAMSPAGAPNAVLFRAVAAGTSTIVVFYGGDPFTEQKTAQVVITVD